VAPTSEAHVPIRTCVGCGRRAPQLELVRIARVDGVALVDRRAPGRGAWLCGVGCLAAARKRRGFARAWRADVGDDALAGLEHRLGHA
jgi:predicted RNA-binding protein YlxR (DUF448 family)